MNTEFLHIKKDNCPAITVESVLSFGPFIDFIKNRARTEKTIKKKFYEFILSRFDERPEFSGAVEPETAARNTELLELIFASLTPVTAVEEDYLWGLSTPVPESVFYNTDAFSTFFEGKNSREVTDANSSDADIFHKYMLGYVYSLVLERLYHFNVLPRNEMTYAYADPSTGLFRYYSIQADTRFIEVEPKGKLPALNLSVIEPHIKDGEGADILSRILPLELFRLKGFSVITLSDITAKHVLDSIRTALLTHPAESEELNSEITGMLKTLSGDSRVEFGLLPLIKLNGKPVFDVDRCSGSILIRSACTCGNASAIFQSLADNYLENPKPLFFGSLTDDKTELHPFLKELQTENVASYAVLPAFYNNQLSGIIEVYSRQRGVSYENVLSRVEPAVPLVAQLLQNFSDRFNSQIQGVIREKFTSLQYAVQWKFNEAAWNYLKSGKSGTVKAEIETITFRNVHPLFGAVDIRDSTIARNKALQHDMKVLIQILLNALTALKTKFGLSLTDELIYKCRKWLDTINITITTNDEIMLSQFFEREADPFLQHFRNSYPGARELLSEYADAVDQEEGVAFAARRDLETSIHLINTSVNAYFERVQMELQQSYPCYFEKFRTDGVEYDIYIGQEIAPDRPFDQLYLKNLRLWQLKSMAEIARLTHSLIPGMEVPLETTQLIFVHSNPIDISFRNDERRFDVEGAYNIRYEIIKKRIDKVLVKDTAERLTQPGKIALVYFNYREAEEYVRYINYLQEQHILDDELEYLDLEELQGVTGLKALRAGVRYE